MLETAFLSVIAILKISWGAMPPDPPRCLHLRRSQGALWRQDKFHMRCFHNHVRYFTKLLKTLHEVLLENTLSLSCSSPKGANFTFSFILYVKLEELLYKYGKRTRDFWAFLLAYLSSFLCLGGVLNKTIISLALVGFQMIIAKPALTKR